MMALAFLLLASSPPGPLVPKERKMVDAVFRRTLRDPKLEIRGARRWIATERTWDAVMRSPPPGMRWRKERHRFYVFEISKRIAVVVIPLDLPGFGSSGPWGFGGTALLCPRDMKVVALDREAG